MLIFAPENKQNRILTTKTTNNMKTDFQRIYSIVESEEITNIFMYAVVYSF